MNICQLISILLMFFSVYSYEAKSVNAVQKNRTQEKPYQQKQYDSSVQKYPVKEEVVVPKRRPASKTGRYLKEKKMYHSQATFQ